ncbi:protein-tyrosine phosphatase-like protein [Chytriomyces sp. MP71]|nr:protein-tyrosine phosphatase-like protein [Chytriomyces sp. MP71]
MPLARAMSSIERGNMRFVVFDAPSESNLATYLDELKTRNVSCIVRVCEPTYDKTIPEKQGIKVYDWAFADGTCPPTEVILNFLKLCEETFSRSGSEAIGIHCIAGLGRAPVLVAISLIESGMVPLEVIEFVRKQRRGAFNSVQLTYLAENYKVMKKKGLTVGPDATLKKKNSGLMDSFVRVFKKS